jgi:ferredoxin
VLAASGKVNSKGNEYVIAEKMEQCIGCKTCTDKYPDAAITLIRA